MKADNHSIQNEQATSIAYPSCETLINPLRSEIVESEKARMDFLKYKLLAVAALGSIGLGLNVKTSAASSFDYIYILGIIPFVCLYVDLLCHHNTMRILVIGQYFINNGCPYENYICRAGKALPKQNADYFFELEDWALEGSTWIISSFVLIVGIVLSFRYDCNYEMLALITSGLIGICLAVLSRKKFIHKKEVLSNVASQLNDSNQKKDREL